MYKYILIIILLYTTVVYSHTIVSIIGLNTKNTSDTNTITCNNNTTITNTTNNSNHGHNHGGNSSSSTSTTSGCTNSGSSRSINYTTNMGVMVQYLPKKPKYVIGGGMMQNQDFFLTLGIVLK